MLSQIRMALRAIEVEHRTRAQLEILTLLFKEVTLLRFEETVKQMKKSSLIR
jgi:hypothetical protein